MVSDRLSKVHKAIAKKKGKNPNLHEGSRDTRRLQRASARDDKLNRLTKLREKENRHYCRYKYRRKYFQVLIVAYSDESEIIPVVYSRAHCTAQCQGTTGHDRGLSGP